MFKSVVEISPDEFMVQLLDNPQKVRIDNISDLRESEKTGNSYFYMDLSLPESGESASIGYNVKETSSGGLYVGEGSKLYPLLSSISGIEQGAITCLKSDIDELKDMEFQAVSQKKKNGRITWYELVPLKKEQ